MASETRCALAEHPIRAWHRIVESGDPTGLAGLLADDAVFHSPVVHAPQRGKERVVGYLTAAIRLFKSRSFRYVREMVGESDAMLEFETEIDGVHVNGIDIIRWNDAGQIVDFKVLIRPLKAINLVHQKMAAMLQSGGGA